MKTNREKIRLRSGMSREEIERYLDELELEEIRMKNQKKYKSVWDKREEYLNSMWLESYDVRRDEQMEKDIEFEENWNEDLD